MLQQRFELMTSPVKHMMKDFQVRVDLVSMLYSKDDEFGGKCYHPPSPKKSNPFEHLWLVVNCSPLPTKFCQQRL